MNEIDHWAMTIGETACRYLSRTGHDSVNRLLCSDGTYSAGWKLFISFVVALALSVVLFRVFRPNP